MTRNVSMAVRVQQLYRPLIVAVLLVGAVIAVRLMSTSVALVAYILQCVTMVLRV